MRYINIALGFIARIFAISIPVLVFGHYRDVLTKPFVEWPLEATIALIISLIILITCDYLKDLAKSHKESKKYNPLQAACRQSSITICSLLEAGKFSQTSHTTLIESALKRVEEIVEISLSKSKADGLEISANCMTYTTQRKIGGNLKLSHWGTRLAGREPIDIKIDSNLPGATQAVAKGCISYIKDTQHPKIEEHFKGKTYRSIVSIPLRKGGKIVGVVNIDSTEANLFKNEKLFEKTIIPLISGQLEVIKSLISSREESAAS